MLHLKNAVFEDTSSNSQIFQILIPVIRKNNNMQISIPSSGVDTVSDHHAQVPWFESGRCPIRLCLFQIQQDIRST